MKRPVVLEQNGDGENNDDDDFAKFMLQQKGDSINKEPESKKTEDEPMKEEYVEPE